MPNGIFITFWSFETPLLRSTNRTEGNKNQLPQTPKNNIPTEITSYKQIQKIYILKKIAMLAWCFQ